MGASLVEAKQVLIALQTAALLSTALLADHRCEGLLSDGAAAAGGHAGTHRAPPKVWHGPG